MPSDPLLTNRSRHFVRQLVIATSLLGTLPAFAASFQWSGQGGDGNLGNPGNWISGTPAPSTANDWTFTGSQQTSIVLDDRGGSSSWKTTAIRFDANAGSFNLGGYGPGVVGPVGANRFELGAGAAIVQNSSNAQRISAQLYLASGTTTISGSGIGELSLNALRFHAGNGGTFQFERSATIGAITSAATGSGLTQFVIKAPSTLTFSEASTGSLGRISFESGNDVGNAIAATNASGLIVNAQLSTDRNVSFVGTQLIDVRNGFTLVGNQGKTITFSSTGGTRFAQGAVQLGAANGTGSRSVTFSVTSGATATVETEVTGSASTGATSLVKNGAGTLILSASNSFNGGITLEDGILLVENSSGSATGSGAVTATGGLLGGHGTVAPQGGAIRIGNAIVAVGALDDTSRSGISTLTFGREGIAGNTFALESNSAIHLDLWNTSDYERLVFRVDQVDLGNARFYLDSSFGEFVLGQSFQVFDWGNAEIVNSFGQFELPTLAAGLTWDTEALYTAGTLSVVAIPEPGTMALGALALLFAGVFRRRQVSAALLGVALVVAAVSRTSANEPVVHEIEEVTVEAKSSHEIQFNSGAPDSNREMILEFTAWYQAERPQGFIAQMKVLLDGEELTEILDRPVAFTARDGRMRESRGPAGWRVPILHHPAEAAISTQPYFVDPAEVSNMTRFRFRLPTLEEKDHEISIVNTMRSGTTADGAMLHSTLKIQDLQVTAEPKEGTTTRP